MVRIELRAAAKELERLHARYAPHFGRREAREHAHVYVRGLLLSEGRKSVEPMALRFGKRVEGAAGVTQDEVLALQRFLTISPWEAQDVQRELQADFAEKFVSSGHQWPLGTVGVLDESSFPKQGTESVGVSRQWCGRLGKVENCQTGVFLVGVTPAGTALLEHQLFLPEGWAKDAKRRKKTRVPPEITFQTKPQIATRLLQRVRDNGQLAFDWIVADETYGRNGDLLDALEQSSPPQRYIVEIPNNTVFYTAPPTGIALNGQEQPARELAKTLSQQDWQTLAVRPGSKGPLAFRFARLRVWSVRHRRPGTTCWLVFQRSLAPDGEIRFWLSNAAAEEPLENLALALSCRHRVEEFFEDGKSHLGMSDYEARSWTSWHHHMSLVALAHFYVTCVRKEARTEIPELTLDLALRIVQASLERPTLDHAEALHIIDYHLERNRTARKSHLKTWRKKHKNIKPKMLL